MRKVILLAVPLSLLLSACGGSNSYSYYEDSSPTYSEVRTERHYSEEYSRPYDTSARSSPPFGGYPVNPNVTVKTG